MTAPPTITPRQILWCQCGQPCTSDLCGPCKRKDAAQQRGLRDGLLYGPAILFGLWVFAQIADAASRGAGV